MNNNSGLITEEGLAELARAGSIRVLQAVRSQDGSWAMVAKVGLVDRTLRSRRSDVRRWKSLDTLARYARERIGVANFEVVGQ